MLKVCQYCGKEFETSHKNQLFCSRDCRGLASRVDKIEIVCLNCGKKFSVFKYREQTAHFCSYKCCGEYRSKNVSPKFGKHYKENEFIIKDNYAIMLVKSKNQQIETLIDIEDIEKCKEHYWTCHYQKNGIYVCSYLKGKLIRLHRFLTNCPNNKVVDHINHNPLDNRMCNLQICTSFQNSQNIITNKSGVCGVRQVPSGNWEAYMHIKNKKVHLGTYKTKHEAIEARVKAQTVLY